MKTINEDGDYTARQRDETPLARDEFDRQLYGLIGLPGSVHTAESTRTIRNRTGGTETFIVQTYRQPEVGDLIFLQRADKEGITRMVIPATIADTIARQRDVLSKKVRSKIAKRTMQERKDRGELLGFQKKKEA